MKNKLIVRLILVFAIITLISTIDGYYNLYILYAGNIKKLLNGLFPFSILEFFIILCCLVGSIRSYKYTPFFGFFYVKPWLTHGVDLLHHYIYNPSPVKFIFYSWAEPFFIRDVFIINWLGAISMIMLSILCIVGMLLIIKDKYLERKQ